MLDRGLGRSRRLFEIKKTVAPNNRNAEMEVDAHDLDDSNYHRNLHWHGSDELSFRRDLTVPARHFVRIL
jgi:hypothetical protein